MAWRAWLSVICLAASCTRTPPAAVETAPSAAPAQTPVTTPAAPAVDPGHPETKWIGNIPYDVFFDQPLTIAADTSRIAPAEVAVATATNGANPPPAVAESSPPSTGDSTTASSPAPAAATGSAQWDELLPLPMLIDEVKLLRTRLTGSLQTVATYNKSAPAIAQDAAILTAMASLVTVHPEAATWKERAPTVRDLLFTAASSATATGREPFQKTKEPFETAMTLIDGGGSADPKSQPVVPFAEVVYVADMMKRIEASFTGLKANINTAARIKENPEAIERELRVLAALGAMLGDASYDSADEPRYQDLVKRFVSGSMQAVDAVKLGNVDAFQSALNQVQTTCAECHQQYRGSDTGF